MRPIFIYILLLLLAQHAYAQTRRMDSMKVVLHQTTDPKRKLPVLFELCEQANVVSNEALMQYSLQANETAAVLNDKLTSSAALYYYAMALQRNGRPDSALVIVTDQLKKLEKRGDSTEQVYRRYLHIEGTLMVRKEQYKEGLGTFYKLLNYSERYRDTLYKLIAERGIGWVYMEMDNYPQALSWSKRAIAADTYHTNEKEYAVIYSNMAAMFNNMFRFDSGEYYTNKAMDLAKRYDNLWVFANALNIRVAYLMATNRKAEAEQSLKDAVAIRSRIGDPFYVISDMNQLAEYYLMSKEPEKAAAVCRQAIDSAIKHNIAAKLPLLYGSLADAYKSTGDLKNYSATLENIIALNDSLYKKNTADALAEIQAKYYLQKKDNIIMRQKFMLTQKNYFFYGSLLLATLTIIFSVIIFRDYRKKQKLRLNYLLENEKRQSIHAILEAEENERKRIAADLHDNLGAYAASIASNIDHIMNEQGYEREHKNGIMEELRSNSQAIVSQLGDTIWALKKDVLSLTEISDRLKVFIQRAKRSHPNINIDVHEQLSDDIKLPPSQAFHLFCILQESVTNALKHSNGKQITVLIAEQDGKWTVSVTDDGDGMEPQNGHNAGGNGMHNMRTRAQASGWQIGWVNAETKGTRVAIASTTN